MNTTNNTLLEGKVVLITGGSAGCGWGFSLNCLNAGATVVIADINPPSQDKAQLIAKQGQSVTYLETDVSDTDNIQKTVDETVKKFGRIDGLINNAGLTLTGDFLEFDLQTVDRLYQTNLRSVFCMSQAVAKQMVKQKSGSIVNISSNHALASTADYEMYAATKGGICAMTRAMSWSLGKHGIRVNSLCPGLTRTEHIDEICQRDPKLEQSFNSLQATNTFNSVEQLGNVGVFLLSDMSASLTGSDVVADQGLVASLVCSDILT